MKVDFSDFSSPQNEKVIEEEASRPSEFTDDEVIKRK